MLSDLAIWRAAQATISRYGNGATLHAAQRAGELLAGGDGPREVTGSLSLDDVGRRFDMLEVRCGNCTRHGRLRIDKLIDEYGRDMSLPDLRTILAGDCEHKTASRRKSRTATAS